MVKDLIYKSRLLVNVCKTYNLQDNFCLTAFCEMKKRISRRAVKEVPIGPFAGLEREGLRPVPSSWGKDQSTSSLYLVLHPLLGPPPSTVEGGHRSILQGRMSPSFWRCRKDWCFPLSNGRNDHFQRSDLWVQKWVDLRDHWNFKNVVVLFNEHLLFCATRKTGNEQVLGLIQTRHSRRIDCDNT